MEFERLSSVPVRSPRRFGNKQDNSRVNVGLVGLGYWGPNLLRALFELPDVEVSYICDLDPERLDRFGRRYPSARATRDFENLLADPHVDAIVIATPVFTHFGLASRALQAGKDVFVEKPLASTSAEAGELLELADSMDRAIMCGHTFLYSPAVREVKRIIQSGDLGEIYFISSSRVNLGLHQRDVSVVWDLGPHDFSILLYWMDEMPNWVGAVGRDSVVKGIPDVAFIAMEFPSGGLSHIELTGPAPRTRPRTVAVGSQKMVVYDDSSPEPVRVFDSGVTYEDPETFGQYQLSYRTGDILSPKLDTTEPIITELTDFIAGVRRGRAPEGNPALARNVVRLIEAAESSIEERGVPEQVEDWVADPAR